MKILIVSQYFYPENFRINDLAKELKSRGHDISVLTGLPNYPIGKYFDGYSNKKNCDEEWQGIKIYRCALRPRYTGSINLIRNYFSFVMQALKKAKQIDFNYDLIYVFEVSPITVALPAIYLKKKYGVPIVINIQDLWPENIVAVTGINNKVINWFIYKLVDYIYKYCDRILVASPSFVPKILERIDEDNRVEYWPQYSIVSKCNYDVEMYDKNKFNIVFTGNIGEAQGINLAIEAAKLLKNERIHWHFIGDGRNKKQLEELSHKYNLDDIVFFHGSFPEEKVPEFLKNADAALLILKPNPIFEMTIPAKLQTYLACGVPIMGCVSGEGKRIIQESQAGIVGEDISIESLVEVCKKFIELGNCELEKYKVKAYNYGVNHFDKKILIDRLEKIMGELI